MVFWQIQVFGYPRRSFTSAVSWTPISTSRGPSVGLGAETGSADRPTAVLLDPDDPFGLVLGFLFQTTKGRLNRRSKPTAKDSTYFTWFGHVLPRVIFDYWPY